MQRKCVPLLRYRRPSVAGHAEAGSSQLNFGPRAEHRDGCRRAARSRNRATPSTPTPTRAAVGNNSRASPSPRAIPILYPIGRALQFPLRGRQPPRDVANHGGRLLDRLCSRLRFRHYFFLLRCSPGSCASRSLFADRPTASAPNRAARRCAIGRCGCKRDHSIRWR